MGETYPVAVRLDNTELIRPCRCERYKPKVAQWISRLLALDFRVIKILPVFYPHTFPNTRICRGVLVLAWLGTRFGHLVLIATDLADQVIVPHLECVL